MSTEKKSQNLWGVIFISAIICGLSYWAYTEFASDYMTLENSSNVTQAMLERQTQVVRSYSAQIAEAKQNLKAAEDQLAEAKMENENLKGQLAKLDSIDILEQKIADLEKANAESLAREEQLHAKLKEALVEQDFKNVSDGRALLAKFKKKINEIKYKIKDFQIQEHNEEIASQKSMDKERLLLGNNGFMFRNGQATKLIKEWPTQETKPSHVQIDVTFVK